MIVRIRSTQIVERIAEGDAQFEDATATCARTPDGHLPRAGDRDVERDRRVADDTTLV